MGIRRNVSSFQEVVLNLFRSEVVVDSRMFRTVMKTWVGGEKLSGFIVTKKGDWKRDRYF